MKRRLLVLVLALSGCLASGEWRMHCRLPCPLNGSRRGLESSDCLPADALSATVSRGAVRTVMGGSHLSELPSHTLAEAESNKTSVVFRQPNEIYGGVRGVYNSIPKIFRSGRLSVNTGNLHNFH